MPSTQSTKAVLASPPTAAASETARITGERDDNYDLIAVVYHALKGAESCARYVKDAEAAGDEQLAQFFEEVRGSHVELAQQAKQFLAERLDPTDLGEDPPTVG
jgi:hypothetical protein